jgi:hypothetical protein
MTKFLLCVLALVVISLSTCPITHNAKQLINEPPKLLQTVTNGQKLLIGDLNDPEKNILYIANLKGTPR